MKKTIHSTIILLCAVLLLNSCSKKYELNTSSHPVLFTSTVYDSLATYDAMGKPSNLVVPGDSIPAALAALVIKTLPDHVNNVNSHPSLFKSDSAAVLNLKTKTDVYITLAAVTALYTNTLGFYTYPTSTPPVKAADITKITYIFPNCQVTSAGGPLQPGDKVNIGTFPAGTSIGFVLLEHSWNQITHSISTTTNHFCSADILNPEDDPNLKRHVVTIPYKNFTLISFEDNLRSDPKDDDDFNDVTVYATQVPVN